MAVFDPWEWIAGLAILAFVLWWLRRWVREYNGEIRSRSPYMHMGYKSVKKNKPKFPPPK